MLFKLKEYEVLELIPYALHEGELILIKYMALKVKDSTEPILVLISGMSGELQGKHILTQFAKFIETLKTKNQKIKLKTIQQGGTTSTFDSMLFQAIKSSHPGNEKISNSPDGRM